MAIAAYPAQMVNRGVTVSGAPVPQMSAADLTVATANVVAWGGNPALFTHFLTAGLSAGKPDGDAVREVAAVAAWRAGVLGLRQEALGLLDTLPSELSAAALGFAPGEVAEFAELQQLDAYWWPGRAAAWGQILRAGGFAGLGGPWLAPPLRAGLGQAAGRWVVNTADGWWQLDADVFGTRLVPLADEPDCGADTDPAGVRISVSQDSYLVSLTVPDEWNPGGRR